MTDNNDKLIKLLKQARTGDSRAYESFLRGLLPGIRGQIGASLSPAHAEDLAQEVLLSVHKALPTYDISRPLWPWVRAITHFRRADYLRKLYSQRPEVTGHENTENLESAVTFPTHTGELKDMEEALSRLNEKQRKVVRYLRIQGLSVAETAKLMGISEGDVKVSAHRATAKLKEYLGHE